jgi:hypothetical protein
MTEAIILGVKKLAIFFFIFIFSIYFVTSAGKTPYDYFTRLSDSFLAGNIYLTENPPWLSELIPAGANKFYVVYPPMPAIVSLPFRFFLGGKFEQQYLAHILGAGIAVIAIFISWSIKKDKKLAIWSGVLVGLGNIVWFMSSVGSSWYLGQITAAFFISLAILESINKKRPLLVGLFVGAAYLSRVHTILYLPLFLYLLKDKEWFKKYFQLGLGVLPCVLFNFGYNYLRFGVVWDKAYLLIPGVLEEPWYKNGLFHITNIPNHLKVLFTSLPIFTKEVPYIKPSWGGLSIWITTPAFIYALRNSIKDGKVIFSWLTIVLISLVIFSHGTTGFTQFGYRFAVDFYPLLFYLTIRGAAKQKLSWHHWTLLTLSVLVNLWGVLWINRFGWVSF